MFQLGVTAQTLIPSTCEAESGALCDLEASMVYIVTSRTVKAI